MKININYGATIPTREYENFRPEVGCSVDIDDTESIKKLREAAFNEFSTASRLLGVKGSIYSNLK